jgi:hypothetical protein
MAAQPDAMDLEFLADEASAYVLYSDGVIQTHGYAVSYGYPVCEDAVDLVLTPSSEGYYVLTRDGHLYGFGDARPRTTPIQDGVPYVKMKWCPGQNCLVFLRADGSVRGEASFLFQGEMRRPGMAVDLEFSPDGQGYYILYRDGLVACFGNAIDQGRVQSGVSGAIDLELQQNGYYIVHQDGTISALGDAFPLPFTTAPAAPVVDLNLTRQGYRILLQNGEVQGFIQAEAQGTARWYTSLSPRVFTPDVIINPTPTSRPSIPYLVLEHRGYSVKRMGKIGAEYALPSMLGSGSAALGGGGLFVAVADKDQSLARKIVLYTTADSTGEDYTGELFAQLAPERGEAVIRGLAYSPGGLSVLIQDGAVTVIALIQGPFESTLVPGFTAY